KGRLGVPLQGTAVFFTADPEGVPFVFRHHFARTHSVDEKIVLLSLISSNDPYVPETSRVDVDHLSEGLVRVRARFGFMEKIDIEDIERACAMSGLRISGDDVTYYSSDPQIVPVKTDWWHTWRRTLFVLLKRNARSITETL